MHEKYIFNYLHEEIEIEYHILTKKEKIQTVMINDWFLDEE